MPASRATQPNILEPQPGGPINAVPFSYKLLLFLTLAKFSLPFLALHPAYQLHRDEYLYLDEGLHLAWGFLEVPPVISVMAWFTQIMGNGIFWVKFWPALAGALTLLTLGKIIKALGGGNFALFLAGISFIFSAYLRLNFLFQPNSFDVFLWTLYFYLLIRYIQSNQNKYLYILGGALGIGLLNKYTVGFFILATVFSLLFTPQRRLLTQKSFYVTALLTALVVLPNAIWQLQHNLPFFSHMQELQQTQLRHVALNDFLKDQLIMGLGSILVWPAGLGALFFTRWAKPYRLLGFIFVAVMLLLMLLQGKSYYTLGLYPAFMALGSVFWEKQTRLGWQFWLRPALLVLPVILLLPMLPLVLPIIGPAAMSNFALKYKELGILRWEDGQNHLLPQDYADMLGWTDLTRLVARAYALVPEDQRTQTIIFCENYGQAGAINYYGSRYNLPRTHATEASYLLWLPPKLSFRNIIFVGDLPDQLRNNFKKVIKVGVVKDKFAREKGTGIVLLQEANPAIISFLNQHIAQKRAKFK